MPSRIAPVPRRRGFEYIKNVTHEEDVRIANHCQSIFWKSVIYTEKGGNPRPRLPHVSTDPQPFIMLNAHQVLYRTSNVQYEN
jgi:hypothetical protein